MILVCCRDKIGKHSWILKISDIGFRAGAGRACKDACTQVHGVLPFQKQLGSLSRQGWQHGEKHLGKQKGRKCSTEARNVPISASPECSPRANPLIFHNAWPWALLLISPSLEGTPVLAISIWKVLLRENSIQLGVWQTLSSSGPIQSNLWTDGWQRQGSRQGLEATSK